jgi:hypothetical protein
VPAIRRSLCCTSLPVFVDPNGQRHDRCEVVERLVRAAILHVMAFEFIEPYEVVARELRSIELQGERQLAEERLEVRRPRLAKRRVSLQCKIDRVGCRERSVLAMAGAWADGQGALQAMALQ